MMSIRAVIFDLGGVLVRTEDRAPREQLAKSLGMTYEEISHVIFDTESARLATVGKITTQAHWEKVRDTLKLSPEEFSRVRIAFWGGDSLDENLVEYIRSLRTQVRTALLSNAWDNLRGIIESRWKISDAFDEIIISSEVGVAKPDPRIYQMTLNRLEVAPQEAVFVDDFIENVEAARSAGLYSVHFVKPEQACSELSKLLDGK
jgi:epoxide hydrolase-like predicted phosphatase